MIVFQKCDFTETRAPETARLQFIAKNVKPNSLPVQLNKNLILIYFSIADYYFLIVNVCSGTMFCHKRHLSMMIKRLIWIKSARSEWQTRLIFCRSKRQNLIYWTIVRRPTVICSLAFRKVTSFWKSPMT